MYSVWGVAWLAVDQTWDLMHPKLHSCLLSHLPYTKIKEIMEESVLLLPDVSLYFSIAFISLFSSFAHPMGRNKAAHC